MLGIVVFVCTPPAPPRREGAERLCVCLFALSVQCHPPFGEGRDGFICLCVRGLRSAACGGCFGGFVGCGALGVFVPISRPETAFGDAGVGGGVGIGRK